MNDKLTRFLSFVCVYAWIVIVVSVMAVVGSELMAHLYPKPLFGKYDFILPSILTWLILGHKTRFQSIRKCFVIGIISTMIGTAWILIIGIAPVSDVMTGSLSNRISNFPGALLAGLCFLIINSPVVIPVGILTSLLVRQVWILASCGVHD